MKKTFIPFFLIINFFSLNSQTNISSIISSSNVKSDQKPVQYYSKEAFSMTSLLKELNTNGNPLDYYHWNKKLVTFYEKKIIESDVDESLQFWFKYCEQLLNAGNNQLCIDEIESVLSAQSLNYDDFINDNLLPLIELLGLAYLRLGEVTNCQENHNEFSCILPLNDNAIHIHQNGSRKAIEIYSKIYETYPNENYKWLLNLAYMTIGEYPEKVSKKHVLTYPNWDAEKKDFPKFNEIAINIGLSQDGLSGGVSLDDFNNDGLIDLFMTSYGMNDQCKLFINTGNGFKDTTIEAGLEGIVSGLNCIHADYDNDGDIDLFILRGAWLGKAGNHPNSLLKNNGDGTFKDVTYESGLLSFHPTQTAAWADINQDGYLDLFIGNESLDGVSNACELYINQKNGEFIEESKKHNLSSITGFVKGVSFGDINNDLWPDLYISVMGEKNILFKNEYGVFKDITNLSGVEKPIFSFPTWFWDVNNDGYEDLFVASYDSQNLKNVSADYVLELEGKNINSTKSKLYINKGDETFFDASKDYNIDKSLYSMGSNFGDLDNDGFLDFYIGTGSPEFTSLVPNRMFKNNNGEKFEEVTSAGGFGHIQKGHGVGFADLDNDGDQDIYAVLGGAFEGDNYPNICFENPISVNNWIVLKLEGMSSNKSAIGTKLKIEFKNGNTLFNSVNTGGSFGGNSLQAEIGLGKNKMIKQLTVYWPNSEPQIFKSIESNKKYFIKEGGISMSELTYNRIHFNNLKKETHRHLHKP